MHISSSARARPSSPPGLRPEPAARSSNPVVRDKKRCNDAACSSYKLSGRARFVPAIAGTEHAVSSKEAWHPSCCQTLRCSSRGLTDPVCNTPWLQGRNECRLTPAARGKNTLHRRQHGALCPKVPPLRQVLGLSAK